MSPSASSDCGNSRALPTVAMIGLKPCCSDCFQKLVKSGGSMTPLRISRVGGLELGDLRGVVLGEVLVAAAVDDGVAAALVSTGGWPVFSSAQARPSPSLGHISATFLLVFSESHMLTNVAVMPSRPHQLWYVHSKPTAGSPPRPKKYACHGQSLVTHGTCMASHVSATGGTVSAVEAAMMMSQPSLVMRSPVTCAARLVSDCVSLTMNLMGCVWPSPHSRPSATAASHCLTHQASGMPNEASGPVSGVTKPILISRPPPSPPPSAVLPLSLPQARERRRARRPCPVPRR